MPIKWLHNKYITFPFKNASIEYDGYNNITDCICTKYYSCHLYKLREVNLISYIGHILSYLYILGRFEVYGKADILSYLVKYFILGTSILFICEFWLYAVNIEFRDTLSVSLNPCRQSVQVRIRIIFQLVCSLWYVLCCLFLLKGRY